jgi:hypothetical protein
MESGPGVALSRFVIQQSKSEYLLEKEGEAMC